MGGSWPTFDSLLALDAMLVSRECDRREAILVRQGQAPFHVSSVGHEPLAALAQLIGPGDLVFSHYRDKALMLALGMEIRDLARLLLGKATAEHKGRQMPGHFGDRGRGIWSSLSPVAHHLLPACGAAWAMQRRGTSHLAMALLGEASSRQGEFFEAVAFAVERRLPVLFVVEDNHLGISTSTEKMTPRALGLLGGLPVETVDARDPAVLFEAASGVVRGIRQGEGPAILWCDLDRLDSHTSFDDQRRYLSEETIKAKWARDPVAATAAKRLPEPQLSAKRQEIADRVLQIFKEVQAEPDPSAAQALEERLGPAPRPLAFPRPVGRGQAEWTMAEAVGGTLQSIFERDPTCLLFGEDVEDPKGGVFGLTKGLSSRFPDRVFNSPLAEATIAGVAAGLASVGVRPFIELQFIDFSGPALSQIANDLATLRWRSGGSWTCPAVIFAPCGGYVGGTGMWHSQTNEAVFCQIPGLRVMVASSAADAAGALWTAAQADDPTVILLPKRQFKVSVPACDTIAAIPFGQAARLRDGEDLTIVCWGNTVRVIAEALRLVEASAAVFDLRSLIPWDKAAIVASVVKTGRLLVVQEDNVSCGAGQMILAEICADQAAWSSLKCPPRLIGRPDVLIGFNAAYGEAYLPQPQGVAEHIRQLTGALR